MRLILFVLALVLTGFGLGEIAMIGVFLCGAVMCLFSCARRVVALAVCVASLCGLVLHFQGYKVLGSATVTQSPKLQDAHELAGLEPPATLRFANGQTETLTGIYFPSAVDLTDPESGVLPPQFHRRTARPPEVRVLSNGTANRAECRMRIEYWCGNTFFPTFFPRRLQSHRTVDFGAVLVDWGLALPAPASTSDGDYTLGLLETFDRSYHTSLPQIATRVPRGDPVAMALGRQLVDAKDKLFVSGARLLIAAQDVESYEEIRAEILRRQQVNRATYDEVAQARSESLKELLAWVDPLVAREELQAALSPLNPVRREQISQLFWSLRKSLWPVLTNGDLTVIDALVIEMDDAHSPRRPFLAELLPELFHWPSASPDFQRWYWAYRQELNSGRAHTGALVMWLNGGDPFDSRYMESIKYFSGLDQTVTVRR